MSIKKKPEKAGTGGSWVVVSGVISRMTMTITHAMRLKTLLLLPMNLQAPMELQVSKEDSLRLGGD